MAEGYFVYAMLPDYTTLSVCNKSSSIMKPMLRKELPIIVTLNPSIAVVYSSLSRFCCYSCTVTNINPVPNQLVSSANIKLGAFVGPAAEKPRALDCSR